MSADRDRADAIPDEVAGGDAERPTLITPALLRRWPLPEPGGTKYARGQLLVIGGARSTPGAPMLCGLAALRMGAGRLSLAVAESVAPQVAVAIPECAAIGLPEDESGSISGEGIADRLGSELERADAVVLGPGLGSVEGARRLLEHVVEALPEGVPVVLDSYGATILPGLPDAMRHRLHGRLVLTPNTGELARLLDRDDVDDDCAATAECAKRLDAAVACNAWVARGDGLWRVTTGDTGLGTSGSGDVMAGAVAGLLSRGAGLVQALVWGKHVHAAAGDALAARLGRVGYLAREICAELPTILGGLRGD